MKFEWDEAKNRTNVAKHGVSFEEAKLAFDDKRHIIKPDEVHSTETEERHFCFGKVGGEIITVRFTIRNDNIRIIGAGYWRKGRKVYEKSEKNRLH